MKKSVFIVGGVLLAVGVAAMGIFGKPDVIDVTKEYEGGGYFGRRFETKVDLIVIQYSDSKDLDLRRPGSNAPEVGELPAKLPYRWYGNRIHGVLAAGSRFHIIGAKRSTSSTMGHDWFVVEIESEGVFKGKRVGGSTLEVGGEGKIYNPQYVVELSTSTEK